MTTFNNENRGVLFQNERKTNPKQPDFTGNVTISRDLLMFATKEIAAGREPTLSLSGWNKTGGNGKRFLSLSVQEPYRKDGAAPAQRAAPSPREVINDDDIPF